MSCLTFIPLNPTIWSGPSYNGNRSNWQFNPYGYFNLSIKTLEVFPPIPLAHMRARETGSSIANWREVPVTQNLIQSFALIIPDSGAGASARWPNRSSNSHTRRRIRESQQAHQTRILNDVFSKHGNDEINQEQFDRLLGWLDPDRETAGIGYERIRRGLIKKFVRRGSRNPEDLADRTINRVARKLPEIQATYVGDPAHYFSNVAGYIFLEVLRKEKASAVGMPGLALPAAGDETDHLHLEKCVATLPAADRDLLLAYYQHEKKARIDCRKKLAAQFGVGMNALRIRACRIRLRLQESFRRSRSASEEIIRIQASN
jgi:DNA-directed RNA polymerase specialized sigma24 family protein